MSKFEKGHVPWSKGKTKAEYPNIIKAPSTAFKKGNIPWSKNNKGYVLSEESRINISKGKSKYKEGDKVIMRGYVYIKTYRHPYGLKTNYVKEHRLVIEKILGRFLKPTEEGHHIDLNKQNNNPTNLILFKTKSAHRRFEYGKSKVLKSEILFDGRAYKGVNNG